MRGRASRRSRTAIVEFFERRARSIPTPKGPLTVVDGFDLKMDKGEFVTLIGHSGCGKSTVLSMAAGLNDDHRAAASFSTARKSTGAGPDRAVVFQAPSLMPWLTARENVALGVDRVYPKASTRRARATSSSTTSPGSALATPWTSRAADCPTA